MKEIEPILTMFELAMVLGIYRRDIMTWVARGELKAATDGQYMFFYEKDVVNFIRQNPERCGRIYCDDLIPFINHQRKRIVDQLEAYYV